MTKLKNFLEKARRLPKKFCVFLVESYSRKKSSQFFENICIPRLVDVIQCTPTLLDAMQLLVVICSKYSYNKELTRCIHYIEAGYSFSESIRKEFPNVSTVIIEMFRVGEANGSLHKVLLLTAQHISEQKKIRQAILTASLYPSILTIAMSSLIGFLVLYIFPKILPVLTGMKITLPLLTRVLIFVVGGIQQFWLLGLGSMVVVVITLTFLIRHTKTRKSIEEILFRIPTFRLVIVLKNTVLVFRTLAIFLETDARVGNALKNATTMVSQQYYVTLLTEAAEQTSQGKNLSDILRQSCILFIPEACELILIGERVGTLSYMCGCIADRASEQLAKKINTILKLAEPIIMLVLGCIVALVALAFMLPLYSVTSNISLTN